MSEGSVSPTIHLRRRRHAWLALLSLVGAFFGVLLVLGKVWAQPVSQPVIAASAKAAPAPLASSAPSPATSIAAASGSASAAPAPSALPSATPATKPIDYATVGPNGGVPIHIDGPFRSPFAHPRMGGPVAVKVGLVLNHVRNYNIKEGSYDAEFYLSLTSDKPMPAFDLDFTNGKVDDRETVADTPTFKMFHYRGTFSTMPDLRNYPFDKQTLELEIEDNQLGGDQVTLVPDREHTHLDAGFDMPGWLVEDFEGRILNHRYPPRFEHDDLYYGRYHFTLGVRRFATSAGFSVFVPAFVIVLISLIGLWLPRAELDVRTNSSAPMLAAAVIFHFTLNQSLPATAYLTRADKLMLGVYLSLILNMVSTWAWFVFDSKHEDRIFRVARWFIPPLTVLVMVLASTL